MRTFKIIAICFLFTACTDNKKIIEKSKQAHLDSAKVDSLQFQKLKKEHEKINGIILDGRVYTSAELDSIFTGRE